MAIVRVDRVVQTAQGQAIAGAKVYFLTQPANTSTLGPLANVYADLLGTQAANPQITDGLGQIGCYLDNSALYTIVVVSPLIDTQIYPDQGAGSGSASGGGGVSTFGQVPAGVVNGTNTTFTLGLTPGLLFLQQNQGTLVPGVGYMTAVVAGVFTITFAVAPLAGDSLWASGLIASSSTFGLMPVGVIDGTNKTFTLGLTPGLLFLQQNMGTLVPGVGYTTAVLAGVFTITLAVAPQVGDSLYASGMV